MILTEKSSSLICENLSRNGEGELCLAGMPLSPLAKQYGTPLYLYDEARIRERCRTYRSAMAEAFGGRGRVLYASKAASFCRLYEIMREEGMGIDVVSCGEIYTAVRAGYPLDRAYFHSNNKTDADIAYAIEHGVGYFVVDNEEELYAIDRLAGERGMQQRVLLARALCATRAMLLLDEPTAGLDPNATHEMYELIASLNREQGVTVIMVTHDFPAAVKYASHILHIGHDPVFFGSTAEYLKSDAVRCFAPAAEG